MRVRLRRCCDSTTTSALALYFVLFVCEATPLRRAGVGVDLVVIPSDRSVGLTEVVRHVAAGAAETLTLARVGTLSRFMGRLTDVGVRLVGTSDQATGSIFEADLAGPIGLVCGAEGSGIRRLTADNCDLLANIPMHGKVDCLNVSVATGICLFEIRRQRTFAS